MFEESGCRLAQPSAPAVAGQMSDIRRQRPAAVIKPFMVSLSNQNHSPERFLDISRKLPLRLITDRPHLSCVCQRAGPNHQPLPQEPVIPHPRTLARPGRPYKEVDPLAYGQSEESVLWLDRLTMS